MTDWTKDQLAKAYLENPDLVKFNSGLQPTTEPLHANSDRVKPERVVQQGVSEKDWQVTVIEYAHLKGWKVAHFRAAMTGRTYTNKKGEVKNVWVTPVQADGKGFFDLVLVRPPKILFVELKSTEGIINIDQQDWCRQIGLCQKRNRHISWDIWRPDDWDLVVKKLE